MESVVWPVRGTNVASENVERMRFKNGKSESEGASMRCKVEVQK